MFPLSLLSESCILCVENVREGAVQSSYSPVKRQGDFFAQRKRFRVSVVRDRFGVGAGKPGLGSCDDGR